MAEMSIFAGLKTKFAGLLTQISLVMQKSDILWPNKNEGKIGNFAYPQPLEVWNEYFWSETAQFALRNTLKFKFDEIAKQRWGSSQKSVLLIKNNSKQICIWSLNRCRRKIPPQIPLDDDIRSLINDTRAH